MEDAAKPNNDKMLKGGIIGSFIAAVCCFTPILVYLFFGVGLSAYIGGIDYIVFPVMFTALGITAYALYLNSGAKGMSPKMIIAALAVAFSVLLIWLEFKYALRISLAAVALVAAYGFYLRSGKAQTAS